MAFYSGSDQEQLSASRFIHLVNLPFHEAGISVLPLRTFHRCARRQPNATPSLPSSSAPSSTGGMSRRRGRLWWLGETAWTSPPTSDDARAGQLMLLGGVTAASGGLPRLGGVLRDLGWLRYDQPSAGSPMASGDVDPPGPCRGGYPLPAIQKGRVRPTARRFRRDPTRRAGERRLLVPGPGRDHQASRPSGRSGPPTHQRQRALLEVQPAPRRSGRSSR